MSEVAPTSPPPDPGGEGDVAPLLARCRNHDRQALGELYRRYRADAMRFIRHAVRGSHDADDILQDVFVEVAHSIRTFQGRSSFSSWLRCICVRTALRHMRRRYRQVGEPEQEVGARSEQRLVSADDPDASFDRRERVRRVRLLLEKIAPKKRMVLLLHDFEGASPKEISTLVGAPVLTVRTRLFYARKELAALAAQDPLLATELAPTDGKGGAA